MKVQKKYKIYANIFFAYVVFYFLLMLYALHTVDMGLFSLLGSNEFLISIFIIFFLIHKFRLYWRQVRKNNFRFFLFAKFHKPSKQELVLSVIKCVIAIFIYSLFNIALLELLTRKLEETESTLLNKILYAQFILFPIILIVWDIMRLKYWAQQKTEKIKETREKHLRYADNMEKLVNMTKSKELGTITGFEPYELNQIMVVQTPLMKGKPGVGLSGSSFSNQNIKAGALGELNFAKILQLKGYLDKFATYWSAQFPSKYSPGPDRLSFADIDCILISNSKIYLIDLKLYSQGNITWKTSDNGDSIWAIDNVTGNFAQAPKKMSKNMAYATERVKQKLEELGVKMKVQPYVVMLPTDRGIGKIENVFWPGSIECLSILDFLKVIENDKPFNAEREDAKLIDSVFTWVLKDESGKAPRFDF